MTCCLITAVIFDIIVIINNIINNSSSIYGLMAMRNSHNICLERQLQRAERRAR